ncbi:MAG: ThuA domain-containing protein [Phycisphaera sp.]|nr:ThuA domain-containing protein [Phycisphaera sp.]
MRPIFAALLAIALFTASSHAATPEPIRALLITGGCCHDYKYQSEQLVNASKKVARIEWTVMQDPRTGTKGEIDLYNDPHWGDKFDVVVHNECFADTKDPAYIRKITAVHKAGLPAVVIHCAMHTYRAAEVDDWREFLGVSSFHHENQSNYPVHIVPEQKNHPIMKGFPDGWMTPKDELYILKKVWPGTTALATSKSEHSGDSQPVFWVHEYGKARVFGTTFGHSNETFADPVYLATVTRGLLWACDKLGDDGKPKTGYGADEVTK